MSKGRKEGNSTPPKRNPTGDRRSKNRQVPHGAVYVFKYQHRTRKGPASLTLGPSLRDTYLGPRDFGVSTQDSYGVPETVRRRRVRGSRRKGKEGVRGRGTWSVVPCQDSLDPREDVVDVGSVTTAFFLTGFLLTVDYIMTLITSVRHERPFFCSD